MTKTGNKLNEGLVSVSASQGDNLIASGILAMPYYHLANVDAFTALGPASSQSQGAARE